MFKKILISVAFFVFFFTPIVKAETKLDTIPPELAKFLQDVKDKKFVVSTSTVSNSNQGSILVDSVKTDKTAFKQGSTITGSFVVNNTSKSNSTDTRYTISINSGYTEASALPKKVWATSEVLGPISIKAGEKKSVDFSYILPPQVKGGDFGVTIRLQTATGLGLGWDHSMINVSGLSNTFFVDGVDVSVNNTNYLPDEGPTVLSSDKAILNIYTSNKGKQISLSPVLKISEWGVATSSIKTFSDFPKVVFEAKKNKTVEIPLPQDIGAGVYEGTVIFIDDSGTPQSSEGKFRYIIGGDIATIHGITADKTSFAKGDKVNVSVDFAGQPFDIVHDTKPSLVGATLEVTLKNESGKIVGNSKAELSPTSPQAFTILATDGAKKITALAQVSKDGKIISQYEVALENEKVTEKKSSEISWIKYGIVAIALIIFIVLGIFWWRRRNKVVYGIAFALIVSGSMIVGIYVNNVQAQVVRYENFKYMVAGGSHDSGANTLSVSITAPISVSQGSPLPFSGTYAAKECWNSEAHVYLMLNIDGTSIIYGGAQTYVYLLSDRGDSNNHEYFNTSGSFSPYLSTSGLSPGIHNVNFLVADYQHTNWVAVDGTFQFTVVDPSNGICGSANGTVSTALPSTYSYCYAGVKAGTITRGSEKWDQIGDYATNSGLWRWKCAGTVTTANCSFTQNCQAGYTLTNGICVPTPIDGRCGTKASSVFFSPVYNNTWWTQQNTVATQPIANDFTAQFCSISGYSGLSSAVFSGASLVSVPSGMPGVNTNLTRASWTCFGRNGGQSVSCSNNSTMGVCGSSNNQTLVNPPSYNLCTVGNASSVATTSTQYTWTCSAATGVKNCSATRTVAGSCNPLFSGVATSTLSSSNNLCSGGTISSFANPINDSAYAYTWNCVGNTTASCTAPKTVTASCVAKNTSGNIITTVNVDDTAVWTATVNGGSTPYNYYWSDNSDFASSTVSASNTYDRIYDPSQVGVKNEY